MMVSYFFVFDYFSGNLTSFLGEWKDGKPHGFGENTDSEGNWYKGNFNEGSFEGEGTFYSKAKNKMFEVGPVE